VGKVTTGACMSLDGFIAGPNESGFDRLFAWHHNGDVEVPTAQSHRTFRLTEPSAAVMRNLIESTGALVVGRRLFDLTKAWDGTHPVGTPVFVVTHQPPDDWPRGDTPFTFVTDGVESAVEQARAIAGDRNVAVNGGSMASQALEAGLIDEIHIDLVPVVLGGGVPFLGKLKNVPVELAGPTVVEGRGVTHLTYHVRYPESTGGNR
jgi:dihydrofolate reductase